MAHQSGLEAALFQFPRKTWKSLSIDLYGTTVLRQISEIIRRAATDKISASTAGILHGASESG
jgi:hypothetical protein